MKSCGKAYTHIKNAGITKKINKMKNKLIMAMLVCALAASYTGMAQGFIGNGGGGTTIEAVNSSGILPGVNVGIGVSAPASGTTLEVATPLPSTSPLGLRFDNLPTPPTTPDVLYYDHSTGIVTYGPVSGIDSVDYDCGVGTLTIHTPGGPITTFKKAWLLSGSTTTDTFDYFGTYNSDDIRINTNNQSCEFNRQNERMVITGGSAITPTNIGNVGIGMFDGSNFATTPQNKLLVENGNIFTGPDPYTMVNGATSLTPNQIGILSVSNDGSGINVGTMNLIQYNGANISVGSASLVSGTGSTNYGSIAQVSGDNNSGSLGNTGYFASISGDNSLNMGFQASVYAGGSSSNTGFQALVDYQVPGGPTPPTTSGINYGVVAQVSGSTTGNIGLTGVASGPASGGNSGVIGSATGAVGGTNDGVSGDAYGDYIPNYAFSGHAWGKSTINTAVFGDVWAGPTPPTSPPYCTGSTCIGVLGRIHSDDYVGDYNYGVWGDLSNLTVPNPNTTVPYFAIYGIAPSVSTANNPTLTAAPNANYSYAGYFDGDVFCSNTYYYSDPKLKENIQGYTGAIEQLKKLPVKSYTFRNSEYPKMNLPLGNQVGVLSTDMKAIFPNLVKGAMHPGNGKDDQRVTFDAVNYNALIPVLIEAVQELNAKTDSVTTNNVLTNTVATQQVQIAQQSQQLAQQTQLLADQGKQIADLRIMIEDLCASGCAGFNFKGTNTTGSGNAVLNQSVPNPTSGSVVIGYSINMLFSIATIQVSDKGGKMIRQFTLAQQQGAGSVTFDGGSVAAGTYSYSLIIDGKVYDTKTMVILKD
jgi:hypothetical protein